jgi:hypothetical protein
MFFSDGNVKKANPFKISFAFYLELFLQNGIQQLLIEIFAKSKNSLQQRL